MASVSLVLLTLMVAMTPISATAASAEIFPSLRKKRMEKEKAAAVQKTAAVEPAKKEEVSVVVPAAVDIGSDGFPELPAVSTMLSEASGTLKTVSTRASSLEAKVVQAQMQSEARMAKQKAAFEEKLKGQEQNNRMVIAANANISAEIKQLQKSNNAYRKHAKQVQETNRIMRQELHTVESHLAIAKEFTASSLKTTDDSKNSLLQVLKGGRHRHHSALVETSSRRKKDDDEDDDEEDDNENSDENDSESSDDDDSEESLLAVSRKSRRTSVDGAASFEAAMSDLESAVPALPTESVPAADPNDLLAVLAKDVARLADQEKKSEKELRSRFIADFRAGAKRHQALLAQQKSLKATRGSLLELQAKLQQAQAHLEGTKAALEGRLHGLGQFLQKLAHFAMAPEHEVPHLMEVLPKAVSIPTKTQKK